MNKLLIDIYKTGQTGQNWSVTSLLGVSAEKISSFQTGHSHQERHTQKN